MQSSSQKPVAIITGASRGVGAATALLLASKGWNITLTCSSTIKEANEIAKACEDYDVEALAIQADVSDNNDCINTIDQTINKWGRIDALINNAGQVNLHGIIQISNSLMLWIFTKYIL
jgi:3-oxoacyl-[acyl-carrier protein] reductase